MSIDGLDQIEYFWNFWILIAVTLKVPFSGVVDVHYQLAIKNDFRLQGCWMAEFGSRVDIPKGYKQSIAVVASKSHF